MFEALILQYGYLAVGLGTMVEGEAVLLAGGAAAQHALLSLPLVIWFGFVGAFVNDQVWFRIGGSAGKRALAARPAWQARAARARKALDTYGSAFVLGFRFIYGIRTVSPLLLGASGYSAARFLLLDGVGAAAWALCYGALGFGLSVSLQPLLAQHSWPEVAAAVLALVACAWLLRAGVRRARRPPPLEVHAVDDGPRRDGRADP